MTVTSVRENGVAGRCANSPGRGHHLARGSDMPDRTCSVDGCGRSVLARGLCSPHYARVRNYGGLNPEKPIRQQGMPLEQRFWLNVDTSGGPDACWPWTGTLRKARGGYGSLAVFLDGKTTDLLAHRVSWSIAHGRPVPDGLFVLHSCDNPPCCNPRHLRAGTQRENVQDMRDRQRAVDVRGERTGTAKLTEADVLAIRAAAATGTTYAAIAATYGIHPVYVGQLVRRRTWKHI